MPNQTAVPNRTAEPRAVPAKLVTVLALAATVIIGTAMGVWLVVQATSAQTDLAGESGAGDMSGMSAQEMAAMGQPQTSAGDMSGMSAADMAAMAPDPQPAEPTRPLGQLVAGFVLLNSAVLMATFVIGRRRRGRVTAGSKVLDGGDPDRQPRSARDADRPVATSTRSQP